jgi:hypothetical protein
MSDSHPFPEFEPELGLDPDDEPEDTPREVWMGGYDQSQLDAITHPRSFKLRPLTVPYGVTPYKHWHAAKLVELTTNNPYLDQNFPCLQRYARIGTLMAEEREREQKIALIAESIQKLEAEQKTVLEDIEPRLAYPVYKAIRAQADVYPDLFLLGSADKVKAAFPQYAVEFDKIYDLVRVKFWNLHKNAVENKSTIGFNDIYEGLCSRYQLLNLVFKVPPALAYMLCPIADYKLQASTLLEEGMKHLQDILEMPNYLPNGKPDSGVMSAKLQIVKLMANRVHGAPVQKQMIAQHTHITTEQRQEKEVPVTLAGDRMEQLKHKMAELLERERRALNLPLPSPTGEAKPEIEVQAEQVERDGA